MFARKFGQDEWPSEMRYVASYQEEQGISPIIISDIPVGGSVAQIYGTGPTGQSSSILPILTSLISGAGQIGTAYLGYEAAKERAKPVTTALPGRYGTPVTTPAPAQASIFSASMLPILGVLGIGAFLIFRGRKKK